ncbi:PREDICTED: cytochrome P450 71A20-like [Camelina sativa]|uniref:Cytochrome P450 71A20-like n=1 Tax=Camelina sativa TaxID=90675 RepID=A0ABM0WDC4_CAMSA|nr:PREDICTED: cytochrome P450 71A20-like [Camelina sativa]
MVGEIWPWPPTENIGGTLRQSICVMNLLSNKTVRSFGNIREEEINVMIRKLEKASSSSSPVNLSEILMTLTNDVMTRVVLGRKYSSEEGGKNSKNIVRRLMELMGAFPIGEYIPSLAWIDKIRGFDKKVETVKNEIRSFLEKVVEEHVDAEENRSDFTDMLLSIQKDKTTPIKLDRTALKNLLLKNI